MDVADEQKMKNPKNSIDKIVNASLVAFNSLQSKMKEVFHEISSISIKNHVKEPQLKAGKSNNAIRKQRKGRLILLNTVFVLSLSANAGIAASAKTGNSNGENVLCEQKLDNSNGKDIGCVADKDLKFEAKEVNYDECLNTRVDSKGKKVDRDALIYGQNSIVYNKIVKLNNQYNKLVKVYNENKKSIEQLKDSYYDSLKSAISEAVCNKSANLYNDCSNLISETNETLEKLNSIKADVNTIRQIADIQKKLRSLNYGRITVNGILDSNTATAMQEYTLSNGLTKYSKDRRDIDSTIYSTIMGKKNELEINTGNNGLKKTIKVYITVDELKKLGWAKVNDDMVCQLNETLEKYDITAKERIKHFISQVSHESGGGAWTKELDSGKKYEGRKDLGNVNPGDGVKYKGAGFIQLTGKANYQRFANYMHDSRIMEGTNYVSKNYAWLSAGFWWNNNSMNALVDKGASVKQVTKRVNGGTNGLEDRQKYYNRCTKYILK